MTRRFDIVVVGAGHAGCEAAAAAARLGRRVAMVTFSLEHVARLSCNPAIGGLAKGCLVRELDALGGWMGQVADETTVQFRRLNTRKGLAVRSSRAQVDTRAYPRAMQRRLGALATLTQIEGEVTGLTWHEGRVTGVQVADELLRCDAVILTTGTFLGGRLHEGEHSVRGGRIGDGAAHALADDLGQTGLTLGRLKTGTPPRLAADSVDWDRLEVQTDHEGHFSFTPQDRRVAPVRCHIAYTNERTHQLVRDNLHRSAMFSGAITGTGPRYCPSIEDKIARFPDRERHQLFLEPESHETDRIYVNGLSTSLPKDVQERILRSIPGLERVRVLQWGYAVEYDYADPRDLGPDLQHHALRGLFLAGQVNGTSGYEEAAIQGFVAGVSAARGEPLALARDEAYAGVLIDDLTTRGVGGEPYRMFSSRAEHRLLLREDNADRRLMPRGRELGLVPDTTWRAFETRLDTIQSTVNHLTSLKLVPNAQTRIALDGAKIKPLKGPCTAAEILRRPDVHYTQLADALALPPLAADVTRQVETDIKYAGYIRRESRRVAQARKLGSVSLAEVDYDRVRGLSNEVRHRLVTARPATLQSAGRLPGVTPAAISTLAAHLAKTR